MATTEASTLITAKTPEIDLSSSGPLDVHLYTIPGSHPGVSVQRILEHKGIPCRRTDLLPVASWAVLRALRFPGRTVPAIKIDGRRIQGSREITRELERLRPEPPLYPADPDHRAAVEEVELFGDEDLQQRIREIFLWSVRKRQGSRCAATLEGAKIGLPHRAAP